MEARVSTINSGQINEVKIIHSARREKTVGAKIKDNILYVYAPRHLSGKALSKIIRNFIERFNKSRLKKQLNKAVPLAKIARSLNEKYFAGRLEIASVEYVTNQSQKFGSCSFQDKTIRISHKIAEMPDWVRDYVLIHEMAHLLEPNHNRAFWDLVSVYPLCERAKGYLIAKGMETQDEPAPEGGK